MTARSQSEWQSRDAEIHRLVVRQLDLQAQRLRRMANTVDAAASRAEALYVQALNGTPQ